MTNLSVVKLLQVVCKNVSEVIRATLRLMEDEENQKQALRPAIKKGLESPRVDNFDFDENLKGLKNS